MVKTIEVLPFITLQEHFSLQFMSSGKDEWEAFKASSLRATKRLVKGLHSEIRQGFGQDAEEVQIQKDNRSTAQRPSPENYYRYESLPQNSFRLVEILPAQDDGDVVQCRLSAVELDKSRGHYEALSYVWGSPDQQREPISLNDAHLEIYESLHRVLVDLRCRDKGRLLWIDAVCINQDDRDERNSQVMLMREIYKYASRTVVYLGTETDDKWGSSTAETFQMVQELVEEAKMSNPAGNMGGTDEPRGPPALLPSFGEYLPVGPLGITSKVKEKYNGNQSIFTVIGCEWWRRAWTMQELLLSRSVLLCRGRYELDWSDLCTAVDHGLHLNMWPITEGGFVINQAIVPYASTRALQDQRRLRKAYPEMFRMDPAEDLLSLLVHCRHRAARDPRDKLYSLLGIFQDRQTTAAAAQTSSLDVVTEPDYGHPVVYVYRRISQQLIEHTGNLDVLGVCPVSTRRALPSWVTDWSISSTASAPLMYDSMDRPRLTHATRHSRAVALFPPDAVTMVLSAHELSRVHDVAPVLRRIAWQLGADDLDPPLTGTKWEQAKQAYERMSEPLHGVAEFWKTVVDWEDFAAARVPTNLGTETAAVYWQTLCTGTYVDWNAARTETLYRHWLENIEAVRKTVKRYGAVASKLTPLVSANNSSSWKGFSDFVRLLPGAFERRLGWATNGWLCLLPEAARPGDRIVLAEGGRVPLVVRPDGDGYHMFIGETYIQGIMDGEAFEAERCAELKIC